MIKVNEIRLGNLILQKAGAKISRVPFGFVHFEMVDKEEGKDLYPVVLNAQLLTQCGFEENKKYALLPNAREFRLALAVSGSGTNELLGYIKTNGECFGRASVNGVPASVNFFHLHQLQNLYFSLTGLELTISNK